MSDPTVPESHGAGLIEGSGPSSVFPPTTGGKGHQSQFPNPNRKISSGSIGPLRKFSDIIGPERRISSSVNPFYKPLEDENQLTREVSNEEEAEDKNNNEVMFFDDDEEYGTQRDDDDGDSLDGDVRTDEDLEARRYCCGEARLNCGRFANEMKKQGQDMKRNFQKMDIKKKCCSFFTMDLLRRRFPIMNWAPKYRLAEFQGDLIAGITVGLTVVPQSIAYASMAGVPNENGLYTAFLGSFVYVIFGTSKDITLGPSAVSSLLTALFATSPLGKEATPAILLAFFVGFIELAMFMLNFSYFVNFISFPVIKAFTVASAITIAASQVKKWFGQRGVPRDFIPQFYWTIRKLPEVRLYDFLLGVVSLVVIVTLKKLKEIPWKTKYEDLSIGKKILFKIVWFAGLGRNIVVIIFSSVAAYIFYVNGYVPFTLTGFITPGIPSFKLPAFSLYDPKNNRTYNLEYISTNIGVGFIIVPILGLLEAMAIGSVFARKFNYVIDWNQEYLAYGIGNVLTSFLGGYPITGTFSRTAVNAQCGVKTPAGGIWTGIVVLIALQFCTPAMFYIPDASLAVVIFMAVIDMVTFHKVWIFWNVNKIDLIPWIITLVLSFVISIAYGVIIGAGVSLLLLLYPTTRPKIRTLVQKMTGSDGKHTGEIKLVTVNTGLLYPAIENLKNTLMPMYSKPSELPRGVILDFQHVAYIDTSTVQGLRLMLENFHKNNIPLVICQLQKPVKSMLERAKPRFLLVTESIEEAEEIIINGPKDKNGNRPNGKRMRKKGDITPVPQGIDNPSFVVNLDEESAADTNDRNGTAANDVTGAMNERKL